MQDDILSLVTGGKSSFSPVPQPAPKASQPADYSGLIASAEQKYGIPSGLLNAVITKGEASGAKAVSPKGAIGVGQLMPDTAKAMGVTDPTDPAQNIDGAGKYLSQMLGQFNGDQTKAVAAYNAGPGAVAKHGGVPPFPETQAYVSRVLGRPAAQQDAGQSTGGQDILSLVTGGKQTMASAPLPKVAPSPPAPAPAQHNAPRTFMGDIQAGFDKAKTDQANSPLWVKATGLDVPLGMLDIANGGVNAVGAKLGSAYYALTGAKNPLAGITGNGAIRTPGMTDAQFQAIGGGNAPVRFKTVNGQRMVEFNHDGNYMPVPVVRLPDGSVDPIATNNAIQHIRPDQSERYVQDAFGNPLAQLATFALPGSKGAVGGSKVVSAEPTVAGPVARLANKLTGGKLLNPADQARALLMSDFVKDGATPQVATKILSDWQASGASPATLADIASKLPNGGQNVLARIRGAAVANPTARGIVTTYRKGVEANVQDNAQNLVHGLHPDARSTPKLVEDIEAQRSANANQNYAPLYQTQVPISKEITSAVADSQGQAAVNQAIDAAMANRDYAKATELMKLKTAAPSADMSLADQVFGTGQKASTAPQTISAGALEEVRQALRDRGASMNIPTAATYNKRAGYGLQGRAADINSVLDSVPEVAPARADYGNKSAAIEATDLGGNLLNQLPQDFAATHEGLVNGLRHVGNVPASAAANDMQNALQIAARNKLIGEIGRPAEGATGVLNRLSGSNNVNQNLGVTFGQDMANRLQTGIGNEVSRVQTARAVDPLVGSKTSVNNEDAAAQSLVEGALDLKKTLIKSALRKVAEGLTLTDAERKALAEMATSPISAGYFTPRTKEVTYGPNLMPFASGGSNMLYRPGLPVYLPPTAAQQPGSQKGKNR